MIIYLITFVLCLLSTSLACRAKSKLIRVVFSTIAIALPVFLAGLRDITVGTDTTNYVNIYNEASYYSESSVLYYIASGPDTIEPFFLIYNYVCSLFCNSYNDYFVVSYFIIITPIYVLAFKNRNLVNPIMSMLIFLFIFYNESLNLMRQYMALPFILLSMYYVINASKVKSLLFAIIAFLFHNSSVIVLIIYPLLYLLNKHHLKNHLLLYVLLFASLTVLLLSIDKLGIVSIDSSGRLSMYLGDQSSTLSMSTVLLNITFFYLALQTSKQTKTYHLEIEAFAVFALLAFIFNFMSVMSHTMYRLSLVFSIFSCISIPYIINYRRANRMVAKVQIAPSMIKYFIVILVVTYWFFSTVIRGSNGTIPYSSSILNI